MSEKACCQAACAGEAQVCCLYHSAGRACKMTHHGPLLLRCQLRRAAVALLVSKRWHRVFLSKPALWRELRVAPHETDVELPLLRHVGGLVASLTLDYVRGKVQAEALSYLRPDRLQTLAVLRASVSQQLPPALQRFSCLTRLQLAWPSGSEHSLVTALLQLAQLRSLSLIDGTISAQLAAAVIAMTQLRELSLEAQTFAQPQVLRHLPRLRQLSSLRLDAGAEDAGMHAPEPVLFPSLKSLYFCCYEGAGV